MQDLRLVLIILGLIAIVVLIAHGLLANKKNQVKPLVDKPLDKLQSQKKDNDGFDMDGIGAKRVVSNAANSASNQHVEPIREVVKNDKVEPQFACEINDESVVGDSLKLSACEPSINTDCDIIEPIYTVPLSNVENLPAMTAMDSDVVEQPVRLVESEAQVTAEVKVELIAEPETNIETAGTAVVEAPEEQVFVINVMARDNQVINGAQLLQELLTLGFKFGEMDIFHRHVDGAGKGAVIFSLANMVKPGTFDIDYMEQFQTPGISLFMMYPCAISVSRNYNMMLTAADRIASAVDGLLCDASRNPLTAEMIAADKACVANIESKVALQQ